MFKKSLIAAASLAALSSGAYAADISLYGVMDLGFTYTHTSHQNKGDTFEMSNNMYAGSRFGIKGTENLGDNLKVGFILENGFAPDTGALAVSGSIFNRESQLYLQGDWGQLGFGRVGAFSSGSSSLSWYWDMEPFETGYTDAGIQASQINVWRLNSNTIYYISPTFAGFKIGAQYSLTGNTDATAQEDARWSENNHFANLALRWDGATTRALLGVEWDQYGDPVKTNDGKDMDRDDAWNVKLVGAWNPNGSAFTLYGGASWYKNQARFSDSTWDADPWFAYVDDDGKTHEGTFNNSGKALEGYSLYLGARYTVGNANWLAMVQYLDGENKGALTQTEESDYKRIVASVGCHYWFSKRTMLYTIASFADGDGMMDEMKNSDGNKTTTDRFLAHVGLTHFF